MNIEKLIKDSNCALSPEELSFLKEFSKTIGSKGFVVGIQGTLNLIEFREGTQFTRYGKNVAVESAGGEESAFVIDAPSETVAGIVLGLLTGALLASFGIDSDPVPALRDFVFYDITESDREKLEKIYENSTEKHFVFHLDDPEGSDDEYGKTCLYKWSNLDQVSGYTDLAGVPTVLIGDLKITFDEPGSSEALCAWIVEMVKRHG